MGDTSPESGSNSSCIPSPRMKSACLLFLLLSFTLTLTNADDKKKETCAQCQALMEACDPVKFPEVGKKIEEAAHRVFQGPEADQCIPGFMKKLPLLRMEVCKIFCE